KQPSVAAINTTILKELHHRKVRLQKNLPGARLRIRGHRCAVVFLNEEPTTGPQGRNHALQRLLALRNMKQHKTRMHQIESCLWERVSRYVVPTHIDIRTL